MAERRDYANLPDMAKMHENEREQLVRYYKKELRDLKESFQSKCEKCRAVYNAMIDLTEISQMSPFEIEQRVQILRQSRSL